MKTVKKIFLGIAAVLAVLLVYVFVSKAITDRKMERETAMPEGGISSLESVTIGGISQWILIRGEKKDNPILLYIHGGPGSTEMFMSRKMDTEIVKDFVVVH
ncbi:MAG TPA: alpha/beta hydrolase, partial [Leptospiraceae bacterium]|nr:alpha/beta hydrolase [Leptospiraceae bacterium]